MGTGVPTFGAAETAATTTEPNVLCGAACVLCSTCDAYQCDGCAPGGKRLLERFQQLPAPCTAHKGVAAEVVLEATHYLNNLVGATLLQDVRSLGDLLWWCPWCIAGWWRCWRTKN